MTAPRIVMVAFLAATAIVHGVIAWWTPVQGDDWAHWIWAAQHEDLSAPSWLAAFASSHFAFDDLAGYVLTREPMVRSVLAPLVFIALVIGLFVFAFRRLPRATWNDVLALAFVSAALWLGQPRAGVSLFHTSNVGLYVCGVALAVWFAAPLRCGWHVPRALWPVLALAGYCVGTSSRAIATATLVGFILALRRLPRERRATWMWVAFGGLVIGVIVGYAAPPWIELMRVFRRGFEPNVLLFKLPLQEAGELISLVAALVLVNTVCGALGRSHAAAADAPDAREARGYLLGWFAVAVWCMFGPKYGEATLLPTTTLVVIAAVPYVRWLAAAPLLRYLLIVIVVGTHAVVWTLSLRTYRDQGAAGSARLEALRNTPAGEVAAVPPYSRVVPSFWFFGEDMAGAALRQSVAIGAFGLRDIELVPAYRRYEANPQVTVELVTEGIAEDELRAAGPPAIWGSELSVVRKQFTQLVTRLQPRLGMMARLVVTNVEFAERGGRPLLAAWFGGGELVAPRITRGAVEQNSRYTVRIFPPFATRFTEAWAVAGGEARRLTLERGTVRIQPVHMGVHVIVVCDASTCLAAEAFTPRF